METRGGIAYDCSQRTGRFQSKSLYPWNQQGKCNRACCARVEYTPQRQGRSRGWGSRSSDIRSRLYGERLKEGQ